MGSINDQAFLIQKEATPGVPVVNAMKSYQALRVMYGYESAGTSHKGSGFRANTARVTTNEWGAHSVESPQCFNAMLPVLASVLGLPVSTPGILSAAHVFLLKGKGKRTPVTFTGMWGDEDFAAQLAYLVFNNLGVGVQRSDLTLSTSAISRIPDDSVAMPTVGIVEVPAVPIPSRGYDMFIDDTWAALGTTKYLSNYDFQVTVGETWGQDTPINSAFQSFMRLVENESVDYTASMQVGLEPEMADLFTTFRDGVLKYFRIASTGPEIEAGVDYGFDLDFCARIIKRGQTATAPNSPIVVLPFDLEHAPDPATNNLIGVNLVNAVLAL